MRLNACTPHTTYKPLKKRAGCKIIKEIEEKRMSKSIRHALILTVIILILSACNLPSNAPVTEEPNAVFTAAAQTVQAQLTQSVPFSTPTLPLAAVDTCHGLASIPPLYGHRCLLYTTFTNS